MTTTANFTGGPGTFVIADDTPAQIVLLTTAVAAQTTAFNAAFSTAAAILPNTPAAQLRGINSSMADLAVAASNIVLALNDMKKTQAETFQALQKMQNGMASIATQVAAGVANQQIAIVDQIKNNEFQQQTTNQSLADAGKPPTVVTPGNILAKIQSSVQDVSILRAQSYASNLITTQISDGFSWSYTYTTDWIAGTQVAQDAVSMWTEFKTKYLGFKVKDVVNEAVAIKDAGLQRISAGKAKILAGEPPAP